MQFGSGLIPSFLLHGLVLFGGIVVLPRSMPDSQYITFVPVELVRIAPETSISKAPEEKEEAKELETKEPEAKFEPPEIEEEIPTPPPEPEIIEEPDIVAEDLSAYEDVNRATPPPEEEPETREKDAEVIDEAPIEEATQEKLEDLLASIENDAREDAPIEKKQEAALKKTGKSEDKPKSEDLDDLLSGVLNSVDPDLEKKRKTVSLNNKDDKPVELPEFKKRSPRETRELTATIRDYVVSKLRTCWNKGATTSNLEDSSGAIVNLRMKLAIDGSVMDVRVLNDWSSYDRRRNAAQIQARQAVKKCAPYDLPREDYDLWRDFEIEFDPNW